jgi:hypothetical protein
LYSFAALFFILFVSIYLSFIGFIYCYRKVDISVSTRSATFQFWVFAFEIVKMLKKINCIFKLLRAKSGESAIRVKEFRAVAHVRTRLFNDLLVIINFYNGTYVKNLFFRFLAFHLYIFLLWVNSCFFRWLIINSHPHRPSPFVLSQLAHQELFFSWWDVSPTKVEIKVISVWFFRLKFSFYPSNARHMHEVLNIDYL